MGRVRVKPDLAVSYMAAAERMLERLGFKISDLASPQELQQQLVKLMKKPKSSEFKEFTIVREGKEPRFVFRENGEIMHISAKGEVAFLFTGTDGAGFVQFSEGESALIRSYIFYSDPAGKIERALDDARNLDGEQPAGTVLSALAALELVDGFRRSAALAILLTGMAQK